MDNIWTKTCSLTFTFDHVTWKSLSVNHSLMACINQDNFLVKGHTCNLLSGQHLYKNQQFYFDLWPLHLLSRGFLSSTTMKHSFPENNYTKYVHKSPFVQKSVNETKLDLSMTGLHVPQIKFLYSIRWNMTRKWNEITKYCRYLFTVSQHKLFFLPKGGVICISPSVLKIQSIIFYHK